MKDTLQTLAELRKEIDLLVAQRREDGRINKTRELWPQVSRCEHEATALIMVMDMIDRIMRQITGASEAASAFAKEKTYYCPPPKYPDFASLMDTARGQLKDDAGPILAEQYEQAMQNSARLAKQLRQTLFERDCARRAIRSLVSALADAQDWSGTRVGECMEEAEKALVYVAP